MPVDVHTETGGVIRKRVARAPDRKVTFSTDREVKALPPAPANSSYDVADEHQRGLRARVHPKPKVGARRITWVLVATMPGAKGPSRYALGEYPELTLAAARDMAIDWRRAIAAGTDPRKPAAEAKPVATFAQVAEAYIKHIHAEKQRQAARAEHSIRRELMDKAGWGEKPVNTIGRDDVVKFIADVMARRPGKGKFQATNLCKLARMVFVWAKESGKFPDVVTIPTADLNLQKAIGKLHARDRVLSDVEIRALWLASGRMRPPYKQLVRFLLATGCRLREAAEMPRGEVVNDLWTVPKERYKTKVAQQVPLSPLALEILESLPLWEYTDPKRAPYPFSTTVGRKPFDGMSKCKAELDKLMRDEVEKMRAALPAELQEQLRRASTRGDQRMAKWLEGVVRRRHEQRAAEVYAALQAPHTLHDLRRTMRTRLSRDLRIAPHVAELVIGHKQAGLLAVYDHYDWLPDRQEALQRWSRRLARIVGDE